MNEDLKIGHHMAEVAANNAGENWKRIAYEAVGKHAKQHNFFVTEVGRTANPDMPFPPDQRAWGQIALTAKRTGIVSGQSFTRAKSRTVHGMVVTMWKSNICVNKTTENEYAP